MAISSPSDIAGLVSDLDPLSVWFDAAGQIPSVVGAPVGNLNNIATQEVTTRKPTLQEDEDGFYLSFDGIDDYLVSTSFSSVSAQPFTIILAGRMKSLSSLFHLVRDVNGQGYSCNGSTAYRLKMNTGAFGTNIQRGTPDTQNHIHAVVSNGASSKIYIDGVQQGDPGAGGAQSWAGGLRIAENVPFELRRLLFYNRELTALEITDLYDLLVGSSTGVSYEVSLGESLSVTDTFDVARTINPVQTEVLSFIDAYDNIASPDGGVAEQLSLSDSLSFSLVIEVAIAESLSITDTFGLGHSFEVTLQDTLNLSDSFDKSVISAGSGGGGGGGGSGGSGRGKNRTSVGGSTRTTQGGSSRTTRR